MGAIRPKNEDARGLRSIFPFVGYFFVADEVDIQPHKFYRANKQFVGAFMKSKKAATKEWVKKEVIKNGVCPHLQQLEDNKLLQLRLSGGTDEFRGVTMQNTG